MSVRLLTEHHLEFLSLTGGCRGSSECTHVKMTNCWKSHALAHYYTTRVTWQVDDGKRHSCQKRRDIKCPVKIHVRQFLDDKRNILTHLAYRANGNKL